MKHLILDNGSYSVKAGFVSEKAPTVVHNTIVRSKDGLIHTGNEYISQTSQYSGMVFKRPNEQGNLVSWEIERPIWDTTFEELQSGGIDPSSTHLTLTETPFQLPQLSINTDQIVFEEYGFQDYYRCIPASLVPWQLNHQQKDFSFIIDSGFNCTWIVPVIYQSVYWKGIKKFPVGGKLLNGLLREITSFRHYDVSDESILINTIKEATCFVAEDYSKTLNDKQKFMCEFVLPDFKTTATGYIRTPKSITREADEDLQTLKLTDERFTIPEAFYHPEIIFNSSSSNSAKIHNSTLKNLVDLIVESIMTCPEVARPLLSANISVVGGTSKLPNFNERLGHELTRELPSHWVVKINTSEHDPAETSWYGGKRLVESGMLDEVSISKKEYFEHGSNWCQRQFGFKNI
ncbi:actin-like protein Arp6p [[Candida] railenensis]|uniref:Actin-like protein ARP6 n=1 Tax=[Candida] railenensis TaxID=45579 RepID=A0A9P0VVQ3_9ASCO|nr:actin-like protein Arp6p [[Candida] railenensis]